MQKHLFIKLVQSVDINMKSIFLTLTLFSYTFILGQGIGIEVELDYPDEKKFCFKTLSFDDLSITQTAITKAKDRNMFNEVGSWNQAAGYKDLSAVSVFQNLKATELFNYFALLNPSSFDSIKNGSYRFVKSTDFDSNDNSTIWLSDGRCIGGNKFRLPNTNNSIQLSQPLPLLAVKTESFFYNNLELSYDDLVKYKLKNGIKLTPLSERIGNKLQLNKLLENLQTFEFNYEYTINFTEFTHEIESDFQNYDFEKTKLDEQILTEIGEWAKLNYLYAKGQDGSSEFKIPTKKNFRVQISKTKSVKEYKKFKDNWKGPLTESALKNLNNTDFLIPPNTKMYFSSAEIIFTLDGIEKTLPVTYTITNFESSRHLLTDLGAILGISHYGVYKSKKKWIPWLTIGSIATCGISWAFRNQLYKHYLASPQERQSYYKWANGFNKMMVLSAIPYSIGVVFDISKTIKGRKGLEQELEKLKK